MNEKNAFLKNSMIYGAVAGVGLMIAAVISYFINPTSQSAVLTFLNVFILGLVIVYGVKAYKKNYTNGILTYGQGLGQGVLIGAFAGVIIGFYTFLLYKYIDKGLLDSQLREVEAKLMEKASNLTDEQIEVQMSLIRKMMTPIFMFFSSIIGMAIWAFFISLISSAFLKKKDDSFDSTFNNQ